MKTLPVLTFPFNNCGRSYFMEHFIRGGRWNNENGDLDGSLFVGNIKFMPAVKCKRVSVYQAPKKVRLIGAGTGLRPLKLLDA